MNPKLFLTEKEQLKVYIYFCGSNWKFGKSYLSPVPEHVRGKRDRFNSFSIYERNGKIKWKDFGSGNDLGGDALDFIEAMVDTVNNAYQAKKYFDDNIKYSQLTNRQLESKLKSTTKYSSNDPNPVPYYVGKFEDYHLSYWKDNYDIDESFLKAKRVYPHLGIDWGNGKIIDQSIKTNPGFYFDLSKQGDMTSWKWYKPYENKSIGKKFKSWNISIIPFEGYYLLPEKMERLLFCSSRKDSFISEKLGEYSGNPSSENAWHSILRSDIKSEIDERVDFKFILFDGDMAGYRSTLEFSKDSGWNPIWIDYPIKTGERLRKAKLEGEKLFTKDLAEIIENYDYDYLYKIFKQTLKY